MNIVGLIGGEEADHCLEVLAALSQSCGLKIRRADLQEAGSLLGCIILEAVAPHTKTPGSLACPSFRIRTCHEQGAAAVVRFSSGMASPVPFRGRSIVSESAHPEDSQGVAGEVIASADGRPVWTSTTEGKARHDVCWVPRPWVKKGDCVFEHLNGNRFMNLLPLVEWLRWISGWREWQQPSLQACFMVDDPNLHGTRYGFIRFAELAAQGRHHQYHTAFATVPLDGYYVSDAAAKIFREHPQTLSFLIHGNNHTYRELAGRQAPSHQSALMQQAVLRTARLEQKSGVAIARVMAPPHGVCSAGMMAAMMGAGLEAVCVSHGSVWTGNPGADWTVLLGAFPTLSVSGLPVIPRFGLERHMENNILLAAYLNQPIIPVGHHWDFADGTDILTSAAHYINSLGCVNWGDMTTLARNNFRYKIQGHVMRVHTFARITSVKIPYGVSILEVEAPWMDPVLETIECRGAGQVIKPMFEESPPSGWWRFCLDPEGGDTFLVVLKPNSCEPPPMLSRTPTGVIFRKVLVEIRDRCMPHIPRSWVRK